MAALRDRRDAAGQRRSIGGEIHYRPGSPAQRPWRTLVMALETRARFRCAAGSAEHDAVSARKLGRRLEIGCLLARHLLVKGLVGSSQADGIVFEEHQALQ